MQINPMLLRKIGAMMPNEQKNSGGVQNENSLAATSIFSQAGKDNFQDMDADQLEKLMSGMESMMQNPMMQGLNQFNNNAQADPMERLTGGLKLQGQNPMMQGLNQFNNKEQTDPMEKLTGGLRLQGQNGENPFMNQGLSQVNNIDEMNPLEKLMGGLKLEGQANGAGSQNTEANTNQQQGMMEQIANLLRKLGIQQG